jgi:anti-sigma factor (TIGR02949 family)
MTVHEHGGPVCRELFARLSDYLDGEIGAEDCAHIEAHMDSCAPCRDFLEALRRTVGLVRSAPAEPIPEDCRRELVEAFERARRGIGR